MAGYPHMVTLVVGVPFSGKRLPPNQLLVFNNFVSQIPMNYNVRHFHTAGRPIDEARNFFAQQAIESGARYLFTWDEDVVVPPYIMRQLVFRMEHDDTLGMVGGVYCQKVEPEICCAPMIFRGEGRGPFWKWRVGDYFEVDAIATGATMIRVEAFNDIAQPWFKTESDYSAYLDGIPKGAQWTEDLWFCDKLKKTGKWKIYADGSLICGHMDFETGKVYGLPKESYPMRRMLVRKGKKKILDIGAGGNKYQTNEGDVVSVDIRENTHPDYCCDVRMMPFATESYDIVFSSHTLEHFAREEIDAVLDEWVRVLKPDGELRLVLPNIAWAADRIKEGIINHDVLNVLYGQQEYRENFHKNGFTPEIIKQRLAKRKFRVIELKLDGYNIYIRATRARKKKK